MSAHHKCDRCSTEAPERDLPSRREVKVDRWKGDGTLPQTIEPIQVTVEFFGRYLDGDGMKPDLCDACRIEIVRLMLQALLGSSDSAHLNAAPAEQQTMRTVGARHARSVMLATGNNKRAAAKILDISYHTLCAYLRVQEPAP